MNHIYRFSQQKLIFEQWLYSKPGHVTA